MHQAQHQRHFGSATELLEHLGLARSFLFPRNEYVFRGVSSAAFKLVPKAHRPGALGKFRKEVGLRTPAPPENYSALAWANALESDTVKMFVEQALSSGLPLPEDSQFYRNWSLRRPLIDVRPGAFPPAIDLSLYALAQHYGVPTSLLDWTGDPLMAVYFAVSQRIKDEKDPAKRSDEPVCIWALHLDSTEAFFEDRGVSIEYVTAPYTLNTNMASQRGSFTLLRWQDERYTDFPPALDDLLVGEFSGSRIPLTKVTLPVTEAAKAYRLLVYGGYHASRVYPGYHSVIQALTELNGGPGPEGASS